MRLQDLEIPKKLLGGKRGKEIYGEALLDPESVNHLIEKKKKSQLFHSSL